MQGTNYPVGAYNDVEANSSHQYPQNGRQGEPQQQQQRKSVTLPPGKNDLEILENLKQIIKNGQHEFYRAIPQPESLARLYLGKIPTSGPQLGGNATSRAQSNLETGSNLEQQRRQSDSTASVVPTSPVDSRRPPRLKNKEAWDAGNQKTAVSNVNGAVNDTNHTNQAKNEASTNGTVKVKASVAEQDPTGTNKLPDFSSADTQDHATNGEGSLPLTSVPISPVKHDLPQNLVDQARSDTTPGRFPPPASHLPEKPTVDARDAALRPNPPPITWQARNEPGRPDNYERPPAPGARGGLDTRAVPPDDRPYDNRDNRDRDFRDKNRRDWGDRRPDRFTRTTATDMRRPPPEERHYEPPPDRLIPSRRYHNVKTEEVSISLSDLEPRSHEVRPPAPVDIRDSRPGYVDTHPPVNRNLPPSIEARPLSDSHPNLRSYEPGDYREPPSSSHAPPDKDVRHVPENHTPRGPVRSGDDAIAGVDPALPISGRALGDEKEIRGPHFPSTPTDRTDVRFPQKNPSSRPNQHGPIKVQSEDRSFAPKIADDAPRDERDHLSRDRVAPTPDRPLHRNGSMSDAPRPLSMQDRQPDRYQSRAISPPPTPKSNLPSYPNRDDYRGLPAKVPHSSGLPHPPIQRDYRGPLSGDSSRDYRPASNNYRPDYDDRRAERMEIDDTRFLDGTRSHRPYSPPPDPSRERARPPPPSPVRPPAEPHYEDARRYSGPLSAGARDWYAGQPARHYAAPKRWDEEGYYKGRPAWDPAHERYDRDGQPPLRTWEGQRDTRAYVRAAPPSAPVDDRYGPLSRDVDRIPPRPPPTSAPSGQAPYSRVRPRSPSPMRRPSGPTVDDTRPPFKRPRDDYAGAPPPHSADYYPRGEPMRRSTGEYHPHALPPRGGASNGSPSGPPPLSSASSFYDRPGPPPSTGSTVGGDRDYMRRDSGMDGPYTPHPQGYTRPRSPVGGRAAAPQSSSPYDGRSAGSYARPGPNPRERGYMPPPGSTRP